MKKLWIVLLMGMMMSGCSILDRGSYAVDKSGYVQNEGYILNYETSYKGEITLVDIDRYFSYFEALDTLSFDVSSLSINETLSSYVLEEELTLCGLDREEIVPKFIEIGEKSYYYKVRDNGYCTYEQYEFVDTLDETESPVVDSGITKYKHGDFTINPFSEFVYINDISFDVQLGSWIKSDGVLLPMSYKQAGLLIDGFQDWLNQVSMLENYVVLYQSINMLKLNEEETSSSIWSDTTIQGLGRNHEIVQEVKLDDLSILLDTIEITFARLGMF